MESSPINSICRDTDPLVARVRSGEQKPPAGEVLNSTASARGQTPVDLDLIKAIAVHLTRGPAGIIANYLQEEPIDEPTDETADTDVFHCLAGTLFVALFAGCVAASAYLSVINSEGL